MEKIFFGAGLDEEAMDFLYKIAKTRYGIRGAVNTYVAAAALFGSAAFTGCSSKSSTPSELVAQSERMAGEMADMAENSPMYLDSVSVAYADGTLNVAALLLTP